MTRRAFLRIGGALTAGVGATGLVMAAQARRPDPPGQDDFCVSRDYGHVRIHAIQTGALSVKAAHLGLLGPGLTRNISLLLDPRWTPWLPIYAWVIEHPEGLIVVDTGETTRVETPDYFNCNPVTKRFYENLIQYDMTRAVEIGPHFERLGLRLEDVRTVVLTHLHSDHTGGLSHFAMHSGLYGGSSRIIVSRDEFRERNGTVECRWPIWFRPRLIEYRPSPVGAFEQSFPLTRDGSVFVVPTPGHTGGHQSVFVRTRSAAVLLAGDATFTQDQVFEGEVAGICDHISDARATLHRIREQLEAEPTVYLPSHDPSSAVRLFERRAARPPVAL